MKIKAMTIIETHMVLVGVIDHVKTPWGLRSLNTASEDRLMGLVLLEI